MADNITWYLEADGSRVTVEMQKMLAAVRNATGGMSDGMRNVDAGYGNLLRSGNAVSNQIANVFRAALSGGSALDVFATGLEAAARSMKLGIGIGSLAFVGGLAIQKVVEMRQAWNKLNEELDRAAKPRSPIETKSIDEDLKERRETIKKAEDIQAEKKKNPWPTGTNWIRNAWEWSNNQASKEQNLDPRLASYRDDYRRGLQPSRDSGAGYDKTWSTAYKHGSAPDKTWSSLMRVDPSDEELRKQKIELAKAMTDRIASEKAATEADKRITGIAQQKLEKLKFSLSELAEKGRDTAVGDDSRPGAGKLARMVQKEEALARKEMLAEHYGKAAQHQLNADSIKNTITPLKDAEKDFLTALERAQVLKQIALNTAKPLVNR